MSNTETEHHIPTTEEIRHDYTPAWALDQQDLDDRRHRFDLWLARHDDQTISMVEEQYPVITSVKLSHALDQLGLCLYPWDGPRQDTINNPDDLKALAGLLLDKQQGGAK